MSGARPALDAGRACSSVFEIHGDAGDQLVEQIERNVEALDGVADGEEDRVGVSPPWQTLTPVVEPGVEAAAALVAGDGFVVGEVVGLAHEGVDGADGVAARRGQGDEGVVEILGFAAGDGAAGGVGVGQSSAMGYGPCRTSWVGFDSPRRTAWMHHLWRSRCAFAICRETQKWQRFAGDGAKCEGQLGAFGDSRAGAEDVVVAALDGAENFEAAAAEEIEIERQVAVDAADERQALDEQRARVVDFVSHQGAEIGSGDAGCDGFIGDAVGAHVGLRNVDAAFGEVTRTSCQKLASWRAEQVASERRKFSSLTSPQA